MGEFSFCRPGAQHVAQWLGPFVQWAIARTARSAVLYCTICIVQNVLGGVGRDATPTFRPRIAARTFHIRGFEPSNETVDSCLRKASPLRRFAHAETAVRVDAVLAAAVSAAAAAAGAFSAAIAAAVAAVAAAGSAAADSPPAAAAASASAPAAAAAAATVLPQLQLLQVVLLLLLLML